MTHNLAQYESLIHQLKVADLQSLLSLTGHSKFGKKNELQQRCIHLLRHPTTQEKIVARLLEMTQARRYGTGNPAPYHHQPQQMRPVGQLPQQGYHNPLAGHPYERPRIPQPAPQPAAHYNHVPGQYGQNIAPRRINGVNPMPLPFYDLIRTVIEPVELPSTPNGIRSPMKVSIPMMVPDDARASLQYRAETKGLPRNELQLRFFYMGPDNAVTPQPDDFPLNCSVRVEDVLVPLPGVIPTNKPNAEPKRPSRPVNITPQVQIKGLDRSQRLFVEWTGDRRYYAVAVYLVTRISSDELKRRLLENPACHVPVERTRMSIAARLSGRDDDGIQADIIKTTVKCPLGRTRISIPARGKNCGHHQCFDLDNFLQMNEKRPTWKCPVCSGDAFYSNLVIDMYFQNLLGNVPESAEEVQLLEDGSWRVAVEDLHDISDDSDGDVAQSRPGPSSVKSVASVASAISGRAASVKSERQSSNTPQPSTSNRSTPQLGAPAVPVVADIITIDDSDDEDTQTAIRESLQSQRIPQQRPAASPISTRSDSSIEVIDLATPPKKTMPPTSQVERPRATPLSPPVVPGPSNIREALDNIRMDPQQLPTAGMPPGQPMIQSPTALMPPTDNRMNGFNAPHPPVSMMNGGNAMNGFNGQQNGYLGSYQQQIQQLYLQQVTPMPAYYPYQAAFNNVRNTVQDNLRLFFNYQPQDPQEPPQ